MAAKRKSATTAAARNTPAPGSVPESSQSVSITKRKRSRSSSTIAGSRPQIWPGDEEEEELEEDDDGTGSEDLPG